MSETYVGVNTGPIVASFTIPDDGDDVDAVSVNAVFQPSADNWQYAKRVFPDLFVGGDYTALGPANIITSNAWTFNGDTVFAAADNYFVNGGTQHIGNAVIGAGTLSFTPGYSTLTGTAGGNAFAITATNTNGTALVGTGLGNGNGLHGESGGAGGAGLLGVDATGIGAAYAIRCSGPFSRFGATSYAPGRTTTITAVAANFDAHHYDSVWCYNAVAPYSVSLSDPNTAGPGGGPLPLGIRVRFYSPHLAAIQPLNTGTVLVTDFALNPLKTLATTGTTLEVETVFSNASSTVVWDLVL